MYTEKQLDRAFSMLHDLNKNKKPGYFSYPEYKALYLNPNKEFILQLYFEYFRELKIWSESTRKTRAIELAKHVYAPFYHSTNLDARKKIFNAFRILKDLSEDKKPNFFSTSLYKKAYNNMRKPYILSRYRDYLEINLRWPAEVKFGMAMELVQLVHNPDDFRTNIENMHYEIWTSKINKVLIFIRKHNGLHFDEIIFHFRQKHNLDNPYEIDPEDILNFIESYNVKKIINILRIYDFIDWEYNVEIDSEYYYGVKEGINSKVDFTEYCIGSKYSNFKLYDSLREIIKKNFWK